MSSPSNEPRTHYAAGDLLYGVRTRLRTLQTSNPDALDTLPAPIGRTGEELLAAALADATGHGLNPADAAGLYATGVLGMTFSEVADLAEVPAPHLRRRRRNTIDRLVA